MNSNNGDALDDDGFRVYRSTDGTNFTLVTTTAAHASSYQDTGLSNNTLYYYKVTAIITNGGTTYESAFSNTANATAYTTLHRAFMTSTTYTGNLGGLTGADAKCQARADAAGLGGTWKALVSTGSGNAKTRTTISGPVFNLRSAADGGQQNVANDSTDFWSGDIAGALGYDEFSVSRVTVHVWTNTLATGTIADTTNTCSNFTGTTGVSWVGYSGSFNTAQWSYYTVLACSSSYSLYCIDGQ